MAYCYAELVIFSLEEATAINSTRCIYPQMDGQAELNRVVD